MPKSKFQQYEVSNKNQINQGAKSSLRFYFYSAIINYPLAFNGNKLKLKGKNHDKTSSMKQTHDKYFPIELHPRCKAIAKR